MKNNIKISILVTIQIILLLSSFLIISQIQAQHEKNERTISLVNKTRQLSDSLMFETEKYLGNVPYADPFDMMLHLSSYMSIIKNGGTVQNQEISPLPLKFWKLHENASQKLNLYIDYLEESLEKKELIIDFTNENFLILDNRKFDFNGSVDYLNQILLKESHIQANNLIILEIGLAIINVGIHIFMILLILNILNKESKKGIKIEKLAVIGELSARLAHDLRNPLMIIRGAIHLLENEVKKDEKTDKRFQMINTAASRMSHQLDDVMDFVRIKELQIERYSLLDILKSAISRCNISESVKIEIPQNDIQIKCESARLGILFVNLLSNAIDAIDNKGTIKIRMLDEGAHIRIEIEDSGPKILDDVRNKMFEPLFSTKETGTGLGLASCKTIVELHHGEITVTTEPTIISFTLSKNL